MEPVTVQTDKGQVDVKVSNRFSLNWKDAIQGLIMAIGTPALVIIQETIAAAITAMSTDATFVVHFNWQLIVMAAAGGGVMYLMKNFFRQTATVTETKK